MKTTLLLTFSDSRGKAKDSGPNGRKHRLTLMFLISSCMQFFFVSLLPTYFKFATFPKGFYYLLFCCDSALHTVSLLVTNRNRKSHTRLTTSVSDVRKFAVVMKPAILCCLDSEQNTAPNQICTLAHGRRYTPCTKNP